MWSTMLNTADISRAVSRYSQRSSSFWDNWFFIVALIGIALFWVALYYWDRHRRQFVRKAKPDLSQDLFAELCQAHRLSRSERALLSKAAEQQSLDQPALLFVNRELLRQLSEKDREDGADYAKLVKKLFA